MKHPASRVLLCRWVLGALLAVLGMGVVHAQNPEEPAPSGVGSSTQQTTQQNEASLRALLASRLGVPIEDLKPDIDLINDLGIDQSILYYELLRICWERGVEPAPVELHRIEDIARYLANASKLRAAGPQPSYVQKVYFATDRQRNSAAKPEPQDQFLESRAALGQMSYGIAEVNIPATHRKGELETPWRRRSLDARQHIFVLKIGELDKGAFLTSIADTLGGSAEDAKQILLYVHGFNVSFDDAVRRAAQITIDFRFGGVPVAFTWPSGGNLWSYNADWASVLWSARHIESFLADLMEKFPDYRIHVVAHSMGSMGVLHALRLMAARGGKLPKITSVILCAPDFDAPFFSEQIASEIRALSAHWVIYASQHDFSLRTSAKLNAALRLGTPITLVDGFEVIDASSVEVTPWSVPETHSYYATKELVIDDMVKALNGLTAPQRSLKSKQVDGRAVWLLP
jgi:esterase/lipase superfamily enzyme